MTKSYRDRPFLVHPSSIIMALILAGVTVLFAALTFAYLYTRIDKGMKGISVPALFIFNTIFLLAASFCIEKCRKYVTLKDDRKVLRFGVLTIILTLIFLVLQGIAWGQLLSEQRAPGSSGGYGYLYALSILHFLHVIVGIPFLLRILLPLYSASKEGSAALFFLTKDPERRIRHTAWYWHFLDLMWIYLVLFLVVNSIV
jgi:cytochrome c oxidase subunit 3